MIKSRALKPDTVCCPISSARYQIPPRSDYSISCYLCFTETILILKNKKEKRGPARLSFCCIIFLRRARCRVKSTLAMLTVGWDWSERYSVSIINSPGHSNEPECVARRRYGREDLVQGAVGGVSTMSSRRGRLEGCPNKGRWLSRCWLP